MGPKLPSPDEVPVDEGDLWRDSTMDLERWLDVVELPVDVILPLEPVRPQTS